MAMNLERYELLKRHLPDEAARVIAEGFPSVDQLVTKDYLDARLAELRTEMYRMTSDVRNEVRIEAQSTHRWIIAFMGTQWLGFAAMIVTFVLKG